METLNLKREDFEQAIKSFKKAIAEAELNDDLVSNSEICADLAALYKLLNLRDSAELYALKGFKLGQQTNLKRGIMRNGSLLAELYDSIQPALALKYFRLSANAKDSLFGMTNMQAIQNFISREETKQRELEDAERNIPK